MTEWDRKAFQQSLPKKRISAGCLFFDADGNRTAVIREVAEELGLHCSPGRLLCVDYSGETDSKTERVQFIFDGGTLSPIEIATIQLPADELSEYRLLPPKKAIKLLNKSLRKRVCHCLRVRAGKASKIYLEEQNQTFV